MKTITLQFENDELYERFINGVVIPKLQSQKVFEQQLETVSIEADLENNIINIKENK